MDSACRIVWRACGSPAVDGCAAPPEPTPCYLCGAPVERGQAVRKWMGSGFTDAHRVAAPASGWVCEACVFITSRTSPVPGRPPKPGKKFGGNFRNYSHLADAAGYVNASKGEKQVIRDFLARPKRGPWMAAIADSGQKHVIPFTPVNPGDGAAGWVQFDDVRLWWPGEEGVALVERLTAALTAGATKDEIESGEYRPMTWRRLGPEAVRALEDEIGRLRGGDLLRLAVWLAQRDEEAVAERLAAEKEARDERRARRGARGNGAVPRQRADRLPAERDRRERAQAVRAGGQPGADGGEDVRERRRVDDGGAPRASDREPEQLHLFGDA